MATQTTSNLVATRERGRDTLRVEALLSRYPSLDQRELKTLIDLFPKLPILDAALMTADERLSDNLAAFHRDHGGKLRTPLTLWFAFLLVPMVVAVGLAWLAIGGGV